RGAVDAPRRGEARRGDGAGPSRDGTARRADAHDPARIARALNPCTSSRRDRATLARPDPWRPPAVAARPFPGATRGAGVGAIRRVPPPRRLAVLAHRSRVTPGA